MHLPIASFYGIGGAEALIISLILGFFLLLTAIPAVLACIVLSRVPQEHRKQSPGLAFLLIIPVFSLIWMFFVHPKVAESLQSYFAAIGDTSVGDCGASLARWLCICALGCLIPVVGLLASVAALVFLILFYARAFDLSARITPKA